MDKYTAMYIAKFCGVFLSKDLAVSDKMRP